MFIADDLVGAAGHYAVAPDHLADYQRIGAITQSNGKGIAIYSLRSAPQQPMGAPDSVALDAIFDSTATPRAFGSPVQPQHRLNANLDNKVLLLGYDLDCITPDGHVALTLYWQALTALNTDYQVFVHVAGGLVTGGPAGIWGQSDGVPGNVITPLLLWDTSRLLAGQRGGVDPWPTSTWRKGQVIRDRRSFQIPPDTPGARYALIAGLYQPETGERLKLLNADNEAISDYVQLTEIVVPVTEDEVAADVP
jgi:hypothetical protein